MYIFVEALTGLKLRLKVVPQDTIQNIKYKIMVCEDLPIDDQNLVYQEKELENNKTLEDYDVPNDATIRLIMKLKGGPLTVDVDYEELLSKSSANSLTDQLAIIFLENGELKCLPILGLEMQSKMIKQTKDDLNDQTIFSGYEEQLNVQKLTILKLKMDCIRLGKKLSQMTRQQDNTNTAPLDNDNLECRLNKSVNASLHRSVSLDSRPLEFHSEISNSAKKLKVNNSSRLPPMSFCRTMSVLDTMKNKRNTITNFPPIHNLSKPLQKSHRYHESLKDSSSDSKFVKGGSYETQQRLPPLNESEFENKKIESKKPRCPICSKKLSLANEFVCRCGGHYCAKHKYPEEHSCRYDFKYNGRLELIKSNPIIEAIKITKI